ncbi:MAG: hypothetical protein LRZ85_05205 [Alphaproteobacteria bacterium]|nr:hypothetical protein [Alphaproteobacteria bacterium]MCD8520572.1 hypothetical protein [Alphaproteobacteria bacterium]MCD8526466.1 hypothetical protein [Alphaproteobacteria bacterium]MCD8571680.1 hypothetical protein [Alphaproteobacteria bacterium]
MKKLLTLAAVAMIAVPVTAHAEDTAKGDHKGPGKMFEETDTDGDGMMSKDEFMAFHEKRFAEMDGNGDGKISTEEAKAKAQEWREKMKERRKEMMEKRGEMKDAPEEAPAE